MRITNYIKTAGLALTLSAAAVYSPPTYSRIPNNTDTFQHCSIPPEGTCDLNTMKGAPNPEVIINGEKKSAVIVVDLSRNILYKYDSEGNPEMAYLIASGAPRTPTDKGIRIVTHTESYPYRTAPAHTKRRRNPGAYGPKIILLNKINPINGEQAQTGEFIHGNNNRSSLGKYVSKGCMRMDNEVIKQLAGEVQRGDIVIIK